MQPSHYPADPSVTVTPRHPALLIALHWATVLAILGTFALVLGRGLVDQKALRGLLMTGHRSLLGLVVLAATLAALVALHAAAALWHHFVRKDGVLRAMLPALPSGRRAGAQPHPSALPNPLPVFLIDSPEAQP